jgi:3-dehydroquinate synthase
MQAKSEKKSQEKMHQSSEYKSSFKVDFSYRTIFTRSVFSDSNPLLADIAGAEGTPGKVFFIIDRNLTRFNPELPEQIKRYAAAHEHKMRLTAEPLMIDGSESCKNFESALFICREMLAAGLCRQSYAVIVGGGALLDAAASRRQYSTVGIRQIRIRLLP